MIILNVGCGGVRPGDPWINLDAAGLVPAHNFIQHDCSRPLPFSDASIDAVFANHFLEHLDAQEAIAFLSDAHRVLLPGGLICIGVPNASYHREVWDKDTRENSQRLFGEEIPAGDPVTNNLRRSCFFHEHKQVFTQDSLWCHLVVSGFPSKTVRIFKPAITQVDYLRDNFSALCNRLPFTLLMEGKKALTEEEYKHP